MIIYTCNILRGHDFRWMENADHCIMDIAQDANISWSAYQVEQQQAREYYPAIFSMLPMFPDDSKSMAMIRHALNVIHVAVKELNPAQVPIVTLDKPLYSLAKQVQWCRPETHGDEHFVIILGGLHIEMCCPKMIGEWLQDSGWMDAIVQAKVASPGTAESLLKASHVSRSRRAHQITACSLFILVKKAYNQFIQDYGDSMSPYLEDWCESQSRRSPQFLFWFSALKL